MFPSDLWIYYFSQKWKKKSWSRVIFSYFSNLTKMTWMGIFRSIFVINKCFVACLKHGSMVFMNTYFVSNMKNKWRSGVKYIYLLMKQATTLCPVPQNRMTCQLKTKLRTRDICLISVWLYNCIHQLCVISDAWFTTLQKVFNHSYHITQYHIYDFMKLFFEV